MESTVLFFWAYFNHLQQGEPDLISSGYEEKLQHLGVYMHLEFCSL